MLQNTIEYLKRPLISSPAYTHRFPDPLTTFFNSFLTRQDISKEREDAIMPKSNQWSHPKVWLLLGG